MGHFPAIIKDPDAGLHIGGILNFMEPLCKKFSERDMDIIAWVSRGWGPSEEYCPECARLYHLGWAWSPYSAREK